MTHILIENTCQQQFVNFQESQEFPKTGIYHSVIFKMKMQIIIYFN